MSTLTLRAAALIAVLAFLAAAANAQSLGEIARKQRAERAKESQKPATVFTNDNIPHQPGISSSAAGTTESNTGAAASSPGSVIPAINLAQKAAQSASGETGETNKTAEQATAPATPNPKKTKEYWQARFQQARAQLSLAKEKQGLDEDELSLLQLQRARELDSSKAAALDSQISAKNTDLAAKKDATAKAQNALDDLQKEFKESGAPEDWSKTE